MTGTADLAEVLGIDPVRLSELVDALRQRNWTVATAESLTAGLLCAALTEVPGSSAVVRGGLIVYATDLKHTLAGVEVDLLARAGPVDPRVAAALAAGARRRCGSVLGLGLTGVAGPDPQDGHPVGTVHLACAGPEATTSLSLALDPDSSRTAVRAAAVRAALNLLAGTLGRTDVGTGTGDRGPGPVSPTADIGIPGRIGPRG